MASSASSASFRVLSWSSSVSLSSSNPSANAFCLAAIAASTAACLAFARRARSRFASVGGAGSVVSALAADKSVIVAEGASFAPLVSLTYDAHAPVVAAWGPSPFSFRSGRPATFLKSRARRCAHSATSTAACESSSRQRAPRAGLASASASRRSMTYGIFCPSHARSFPKRKRFRRKGDSNSAERYAFSENASFVEFVSGTETSRAVFTSAIADNPRSCRSAFAGLSDRKHTASRANVAKQTWRVNSRRFLPKLRRSRGGFGARSNVAGDQAKVLEDSFASFSPAFSRRTHSRVASASAASCSLREYRWKNASKPKPSSLFFSVSETSQTSSLSV
mmetsp:Transcript_15714/g.66205  ORF Transcript_15714/g.66205 Transcript_15714/m.66205 type:complete len:336 (+) Transcript_15714:611-1618(+)